jgi:hypothetical protein
LFTIHSVSSDRELIFSNREGDFFNVELKGIEVSGAKKVWTHDDANTFKNFFKELAGFEKPWQGSLDIQSLEGEFEISVSCTNLGNVIFSIKISSGYVDREEWHLKADLDTELGQLPQIAKNAEIFFNGKG